MFMLIQRIITDIHCMQADGSFSDGTTDHTVRKSLHNHIRK